MDWTEMYRRFAVDRNDAEAFEALTARVRSWVSRGLADRGVDVVGDAIADTCSTALLSFDRAHGPDTFSGFVYGYYLNVRSRVLRGRPLFSLHEHGVRSPELIQWPREPEDVDRINQLRQWVSELPERERQAIELRYFLDASAEQIGASLGVTPNNARKIVYRGLARLRRRATESYDASSLAEPDAHPVARS